MTLWTAFLISFTALLPLINPLGSAFVLLGVVGEASPEAFGSVAKRVALNNIIFLGTIELLGAAILHFFGISLPIVQVSGGIVIALIGWSVLNDPGDACTTREKEVVIIEAPEQAVRSLERKAFYPLTFPITSGPGTLVVMLTLSARFSAGHFMTRLLGHVGLFCAVSFLSGCVYICYAHAPLLRNTVSSTTINGVLRIVAFILICVGAQIAWHGFTELLHDAAPTLWVKA